MGNSQLNIGGLATDKKSVEKRVDSSSPTYDKPLGTKSNSSLQRNKTDLLNISKPSNSNDNTKQTPKSTTGLGTTAFDQPNHDGKSSVTLQSHQHLDPYLKILLMAR